MTHEGGCLCGAVGYTVAGPLREILVCHCNQCRRWAGRAWAATAAHAGDLAITGAVSWNRSPHSDHHAERGSCGRCGASLFWRAPGSDRVSIGAGTLRQAPELRVAAHIWTEQALAGDPPVSGVPAYARGYPDDAAELGWR